MNHAFTTVLRVMLLFPLLSTQLCAEELLGRGQVSMTGSIAEGACSIDAGSAEQVIDLSPRNLLKGRSEADLDKEMKVSREFIIRLTQCALNDANNPSEAQYFQIKFSGLGVFGNYGAVGKADGVFFKIEDQFGNAAEPGVILNNSRISSNINELKFTASINSKGKNFLYGNYRSLVRFGMNYY
ncbi:fimbrial protein [Pantoea sp. 1.19]|uniref:fimbrial protein n=1 Tax=Pantoea sp. 1.19 TaxID=1925589 RepID=UPI000948C162|nr:type 1 fimbrial protein [Pantoea sp. 1.19]